MFASYEVLATFGISAVLSFGLSMVILLVVAAKRGFFRIGAGKSSIGRGSVEELGVGNKTQIGSPLLFTPTAPPLPMVVELAPLKEYPK